MVTRRDYILLREYKLRLKFEKEPALCEEQGGRVLKVERATCALKQWRVCCVQEPNADQCDQSAVRQE